MCRCAEAMRSVRGGNGKIGNVRGGCFGFPPFSWCGGEAAGTGLQLVIDQQMLSTIEHRVVS
jgi:hypothetical protein